MKIVKPYEKRERHQTVIEGKSMTKQSMKDECDINNIVKKYDRTGVLTHVNTYEAQYGEVSAQDFLEAMLIVKEAENMFQSLPSEVRSRFDGDPAKFLEFMDNPDNIDEMVELGLAEYQEQDEPVEVIIREPEPSSKPAETPPEAS